MFGRLIGLLKEGQADGTFRSDLDVVKTALVLWSCMVGAVNTAKVKAGYIQNYHHVTPEDLVSYALQIMLQSIKGAMEEK
ncbi:hypothetical protein QS257_17250 [Terrilactibacillus sp. S3-3]|nr:hypothetical protein QS257_17250 [Terrilactibacillus sp. S3-3]